MENVTTGWFITRVAGTSRQVSWIAESEPITLERDPRDSAIQRFKITGSTTHYVAPARSTIQGMKATGPKAQRPSICPLAGSAGCEASGVETGCLAGTQHHTGSLAVGGLNAGLLTVTV